MAPQRATGSPLNRFIRLSTCTPYWMRMRHAVFGVAFDDVWRGMGFVGGCATNRQQTSFVLLITRWTLRIIPRWWEYFRIREWHLRPNVCWQVIVLLSWNFFGPFKKKTKNKNLLSTLNSYHVVDVIYLISKLFWNVIISHWCVSGGFICPFENILFFCLPESHWKKFNTDESLLRRV